MNNTEGDEMENRIKMLRKEAGISQKKLGDELGVAQTTISAWESGRNEPDYDSIRKMANILCTSPDYLMGYNDKDIPESYKDLNISEEKKKHLAFQERRDKFKSDYPEMMDEYIDPEHFPDYQEEKQNEINEAWDMTGRKVYRESAEIDVIFEERNLDQESRERAVKVIDLMFPEK